MEQLDLTSPIVTSTVSSYKVYQLLLFTAPAKIDCSVIDNNGKVTNFTFTGTQATTLLSALNTGNFSTTSMQKTIINYLVNNSYLPAGTVSGIPQ